jgi:hypothetical protein
MNELLINEQTNKGMTGLAIKKTTPKNPPKNPLKMFFWGFFWGFLKFLVFYENNTNFSL